MQRQYGCFAKEINPVPLAGMEARFSDVQPISQSLYCPCCPISPFRIKR